jgi:hypothetical protein
VPAQRCDPDQNLRDDPGPCSHGDLPPEVRESISHGLTKETAGGSAQSRKKPQTQ